MSKADFVPGSNTVLDLVNEYKAAETETYADYGGD